MDDFDLCSRRSSSPSGKSLLQEGAPIDDVQDEEREREEESGELVDVDRCRSALAAGVVLHGQRPDGTPAPLGLVPHRRLSKKLRFSTPGI